MNWNELWRVDAAVLTTVNASIREGATVEELVGWLDGTLNIEFGKASLCIYTFFVEVPLENQMSFIAGHGLDLNQVDLIADKFVRPEVVGTIPLNLILPKE